MNVSGNLAGIISNPMQAWVLGARTIRSSWRGREGKALLGQEIEMTSPEVLGLVRLKGSRRAAHDNNGYGGRVMNILERG